jgi:FAD/FMN-containing dehydrogenase
MSELQLAGRDGQPRAVERQAIEALRAGLRGSLLWPGAPGYDEARQIHNMIHDRHPGLIARCAGVADVISVVDFARDHRLLVAIRGGGHSVPGFSSCDGGLVIDLSRMASVQVDPVKRLARAEGGATWGGFFHETQAFGLACTGGVNRPTGIAGLTLGGGHGFLMRSQGFSCDNLVSMDVVTADGRFLTASATENSDLFWALRGGGGNFGVVTSFVYRLHDVGPMIYGGLLLWPMEKAPRVLAYYREFCLGLPDETGTFIVMATMPDGPRGLGILFCHNGSHEDGARLVEPLRRFGDPLVDRVGPMPYMALQSVSETFNPPGIRNYWKSGFVKDLGTDVVQAILGQLADVPHPFCHVLVEHLGGAIRRVGPDDTAVDFRDVDYNVLIVGMWTDPADDQRGIGWVRGLWQALKPFSTGAEYSNYADIEAEGGVAAVHAAYESGKYRRLAVVKQKYDPQNMFRLNQNIRPGDA